MTRTSRFSGKQVVMISVAVCIAVIGGPLGVMAGTGTSVSISDAHHKNVAKVSKAGALSVSVGSKPLAVKGKIAGTVAVNGSVTPAIPAKPLYAEGTIGGTAGTDGFVWSGTAAANIAITSVILSSSGAAAGPTNGYLAFYSQPTAGVSCGDVSGHGFAIAQRLPLSLPNGQTTEVTFPTPMVWGDHIAVGGSNCITMEVSGPAEDAITYVVNGYLD